MKKSGRIYLQNTYLLKSRYAEYIKNAQNSMIRKQTKKKKTGQRSIFRKECICIASKHMKKCSMLFAVRKT